MSQHLQDRVAVITGGASGIGLASAERFAREGASVVIADLNEDRAVAAAADIESKGGTAHAVRADASSVADNESMIRTALEKYGRLDVVVAAAGMSHSGYVSGESNERANETMLDLDVADWQRVLDVNLTGVMLTNQVAARAMIEAGNGGSIVNISSVASRVPLPGFVDYCVSKAGVWMLTKTFAVEMTGFGIRVNAIGPGFVETPMTARGRQDPEGLQMMQSMTPMGRLGTPGEIADTALFLASDQSSYYTGQILFPCGGIFLG